MSISRVFCSRCQRSATWIARGAPTRHGTTTLFAALDVASGKVISRCKPGHRHTEFIAFLRQIDTNTTPELGLHVIVDNYATHKHPEVKVWLARHPRFHFHFTPTYSSWLN